MIQLVGKKTSDKPAAGTNVQVTKDAHESLRRICKNYRRCPQNSVIEGMITWLEEMDLDTQGAIIGQLPYTREKDWIRRVLRDWLNETDEEVETDDSPALQTAVLAARRKAQKDKKSGSRQQDEKAG